MHHERIVLGHGSGGRLSHDLLDRVIFPPLDNRILEGRTDHATLNVGGDHRIAFTTDTFVITPLFFPGGDIGTLAVHGTINDLAVGGAIPLALSLSLVLEEGFELRCLERILLSIGKTAKNCGVFVATGDTKVVERGAADGIFLNTSGIGIFDHHLTLGPRQIEAGDAIIISGTIGEHGASIALCRDMAHPYAPIVSDTAPLHDLTQKILKQCSGIKVMRDPTRGGLAATLHELAKASQLGMLVQESSVPVSEDVASVCELYGLDPWHLACEGRIVLMCDPRSAEKVVEVMRSTREGSEACILGRVTHEYPGIVVAETDHGSQRVVDLPLYEPLPRIC